MRSDLAELTERWDKEKALLAERQERKQRLETARRDLEQAQQKGDFARAGELTHSIIPELEEAEAADAEADAGAQGDGGQ